MALLCPAHPASHTGTPTTAIRVPQLRWNDMKLRFDVVLAS